MTTNEKARPLEAKGNDLVGTGAAIVQLTLQVASAVCFLFM